MPLIHESLTESMARDVHPLLFSYIDPRGHLMLKSTTKQDAENLQVYENTLPKEFNDNPKFDFLKKIWANLDLNIKRFIKAKLLQAQQSRNASTPNWAQQMVTLATTNSDTDPQTTQVLQKSICHALSAEIMARALDQTKLLAWLKARNLQYDKTNVLSYERLSLHEKIEHAFAHKLLYAFYSSANSSMLIFTRYALEAISFEEHKKSLYLKNQHNNPFLNALLSGFNLDARVELDLQINPLKLQLLQLCRAPVPDNSQEHILWQQENERMYHLIMSSSLEPYKPSAKATLGFTAKLKEHNHGIRAADLEVILNGDWITALHLEIFPLFKAEGSRLSLTTLKTIQQLNAMQIEGMVLGVNLAAVQTTAFAKRHIAAIKQGFKYPDIADLSAEQLTETVQTWGTHPEVFAILHRVHADNVPSPEALEPTIRRHTI